MSTGKRRLREGDCWARSLPLGYNAVSESFFGTLKLELVFSEKYISRDRAKRIVVDYIEMFYNSNRRHSCLDYISPVEYESQWLLKKAA